jgi:hypothetical protein
VRLYGTPTAEYCYVTLGGTELKDVESLRFVDSRLTSTVSSYEANRSRHKLAQQRATELSGTGLNIALHHATIFSHQRVVSDLPHIFFLDLEGICAWSDYDQRFADLSERDHSRRRLPVNHEPLGPSTRTR